MKQSRRPAASSSGYSSPSTTGANPSTSTDETHGPVGVDGAFNAPEPVFGEAVADDDLIKVLHGPSNKLRGEHPPTAEALYQRSEWTNLWATFHTDSDYKQVNSIEGTPETPAVTYDQAVENNLYIHGSPSIADIHQGDLADCYFLASIGSIVASDPGQIQSMISGTAAGATVTLFRKDGPNVVPVSLNVTHDLRVEDLGDGVTGIEPLGAGVRAGDAPKAYEHYATIDDTTLRVYADAFYEMAMWAPLLEKAYAQYAGQYGQYGGFGTEEKPASGEDGAPDSDYGYLNGGLAQMTYHIVYGSDVVSADEQSWTVTPGTDAITANPAIVQNLLWASGVGTPAGVDMHMTVGANRNEMVERLSSMTTALLARSDIDTHADLKTDLTVLQTHITTWRGADEADKDARLQDVASAATDALSRTDHPELFDTASPQAYRDFAENLAIVANIATDHSTGDRHTYAWHSYSVLGVTLKKADGSALSMTPDEVPARVGEIDSRQSSVRLRNPHGTNEPNLQTSDSSDDGEFSMTLDSYARSFSFQQFGVVRT